MYYIWTLTFSKNSSPDSPEPSAGAKDRVIYHILSKIFQLDTIQNVNNQQNLNITFILHILHAVHTFILTISKLYVDNI